MSPVWAVGFDEVNDKIARYSAKSKEDLRDYLLVHSVPIGIGNGGGFYLTDHHHMANDPYRSLAWEVRQRYGYAKSPHAFAEFLWADFFRIRIVIDNWILKDEIREENVLIGNLPEEHRKEIIDEATYLARSHEAAGMPGYLGSN